MKACFLLISAASEVSVVFVLEGSGFLEFGVYSFGFREIGTGFAGEFRVEGVGVPGV